MSELIETLRDAVENAIKTMKERRQLYRCEKRIEFLDRVILEYQSALSLLSSPDALTWALLRDMAVRDKVRVSKSRQEVTFPFRDEVCDVWTFRAGIENVVHYIEPPSDPIVGSSIRVEEFVKAEDLQLCLAAAIAFRDERRREVCGE